MKVIKIGRDLSNDYVISHPAVSRFHADLYVYDNKAMQLVEHSSVGTYVNDTYVNNMTVILQVGDVLIFPDQNPIPVGQLLSMGSKHDAQQSQTRNLNYGHSEINNHSSVEPEQHRKPASTDVSFGKALGLFFQRYVDFSGRSRRKEYWFMVLWNMIFAIIPIVNIFWWIATIIPGWALCVRRLHDIGKSGWFMLLILIPIVGPIVLLIWYCTDSMPASNNWGPSPKYE